MQQAVWEEQPDRIIHLGDCESDAVRLHAKFPEIPLDGVPGNCDCSIEEPVRVLIIEGVQVMICHGHTYHVKMQKYSLECAAREKGAQVALFGHTHMVFSDWHNGVRMYNPGSIGAPLMGNPPSYGVLTIDGDCTDPLKAIHMETKYFE